MRINDTANHHFRLSIDGKKTNPDEQRKHDGKPVELRISDILELSGKIPKLPGYMKDVKYFLDVPEELNRTLHETGGILVDESELWKGNPGAYDVELLLEDLKNKYQYGVARKTDINERLADKEQVMREIAAIAQKFNLSDDKLNDFMKTMKGLTDEYTDTYDTYGNSELLNISDETRRDSYYQFLFVGHADKVNTFMQSSVNLYGRNAYNTELSVKRYEELRDEIIRTFGDDKELRDKNLASLDKGFSWHLRSVAVSASFQLEVERSMNHAAEVTGEEPPWELNKLATHKNFNWEKFRKNAENLMRQFAQEYIMQINSGMSYSSAWDNAVEIMTGSTKTTSVNELSFSDFMIFDGKPVSNATTKVQNIIARNEQSVYFNTNPNLSDELRKILK